MPDSPPAAVPVLCLDVGSTWTKAALVGPGGELLGTAQHPSTPPEVLHGVEFVTSSLRARPDWPVLACSSAGGGLRLAVVGQEPLVSAEAGRRVALSAGARVVHVHSGYMTGAQLRSLRAARPDVVLLVGGTDGGDQRTLLHNASRLAVNRVAAPVVLAGNAAARDDALALLRSTGRTVVVTGNVLPDVGELDPGPAREAIREVFLRHVIGGKGLSRGPRFRRLVRLVTPDAVLVGVSRLAAVLGGIDGTRAKVGRPSGAGAGRAEGGQPAGGRAEGAVVVVDVGGATTDVYSAVAEPTEARHVVALPAQRRTVEGDLGMRHSAAGVATAALAERLITPDEATALANAALPRAAHPDWIPTSDGDATTDARLAALAATTAIRRHLKMIDNQLGPRGAGLLVLSGGVFRHADAGALAVIEKSLREDAVLRPILRHADLRVDADYVLAPAGLLAHTGAAPAADALLARAFQAP
jgi:MutL protein